MSSREVDNIHLNIFRLTRPFFCNIYLKLFKKILCSWNILPSDSIVLYSSPEAHRFSALLAQINALALATHDLTLQMGTLDNGPLRVAVSVREHDYLQQCTIALEPISPSGVVWKKSAVVKKYLHEPQTVTVSQTKVLLQAQCIFSFVLNLCTLDFTLNEV